MPVDLTGWLPWGQNPWGDPAGYMTGRSRTLRREFDIRLKGRLIACYVEQRTASRVVMGWVDLPRITCLPWGIITLYATSEIVTNRVQARVRYGIQINKPPLINNQRIEIGTLLLPWLEAQGGTILDDPPYDEASKVASYSVQNIDVSGSAWVEGYCVELFDDQAGAAAFTGFYEAPVKGIQGSLSIGGATVPAAWSLDLSGKSTVPARYVLQEIGLPGYPAGSLYTEAISTNYPTTPDAITWLPGQIPTFVAGAIARCRETFVGTPEMGTPANLTHSRVEASLAGWGEVVTLPSTTLVFTYKQVKVGAYHYYRPPQTLNLRYKAVRLPDGALDPQEIRVDTGLNLATLSRSRTTIPSVQVDDTPRPITIGGTHIRLAYDYIHLAGAPHPSFSHTLEDRDAMAGEYMVGAWFTGQADPVAGTFPTERAGTLKARFFLPWDALRASQAASKRLVETFTLGNFEAGKWTGENGASLSISGGALRITTNAQTNALAKRALIYYGTWPFGIVLPDTALLIYPRSQCPRLEYRRLRVRLRSIGAAGKTIQMGMRHLIVGPSTRNTPLWSLTTGGDGEWVEREIDICSTPPATPHADVPRDNWEIWGIEITVPGSTTVEIAWIEGFRTGAPALSTLSVLPEVRAQGNLTRRWPENNNMLDLGSPAEQLGRLHGWSDGWPSIAHANRLDLETSSTLRRIMSEIAGAPWPAYVAGGAYTAHDNPPLTPAWPTRPWGYSWTLTDLAPPRGNKPYQAPAVGTPLAPGTTTYPWASGDLADSDAWGWNLGGDGLIEEDWEESFQLDVLASGPGATLRAQKCLAWIRLYPGCGDVGAGGRAMGTYGNATPLRLVGITRGQVIGMLIPQGAASGSVPVEEIEEASAPLQPLVPLDPHRAVGTLETVAGSGGFAAGGHSLLGRPPIPPGSVSVLYQWPWWRKIVNWTSDRIEPMHFRIEPLWRQRWYVRHWPTSQGASPENLASPWGWYATVHVDNGRIRYRKSHLSQARMAVDGDSWEIDLLATQGDGDAEPALLWSGEGRLDLLFTRGGNVVRCASYDDGRTWGEVETMIEGGRHVEAATDQMGSRLVAAYVPGGEGQPGTIVGVFAAPGDYLEDAEPFTFQRRVGAALEDLPASDDCFGLCPAWDAQGSWNLAVLLHGETSPRYFYSYDEGRTWALVEE